MAKQLLITAIACLIAVPAFAQMTYQYGWEDCGTLLGYYGTGDPAIIATNVMDPVHSGMRALQLEDNSPTGTPQAYICWIVGLQNGDEVQGCFWRYDVTPDLSPSCRIWAHYTPIGGDINSYAGSASGNSDYGPSTGWDQTCWTWEMITTDPTGTYPDRDGIVIECRTYSNPGDTVWIDDLLVIVPDYAMVYFPEPGASAANNTTWGGIKTLYR